MSGDIHSPIRSSEAPFQEMDRSKFFKELGNILTNMGVIEATHLKDTDKKIALQTWQVRFDTIRIENPGNWIHYQNYVSQDEQ